MKQYLGSQEAFEDEINERYDEMERRDKEQERQIEKQAYQQMEADYLNQIESE